jgi:uroporphyrinogen decarboxylase
MNPAWCCADKSGAWLVLSLRNRERTLAALSHETTDRLPFDRVGSTGSAEVANIVESLDLPPAVRAHYLEGDFHYLEFGSREERERFRAYLPDLPAEASVSDWGIARIPLKTAEGYHAGHKYFYPLAHLHSPAQLESYPFPDLTESWRHQGLEEAVRAAKRQGYVVVGQMSQTILETAYCMRGIVRLFVDFYERPGYVELLFERIAEGRRFQARRFAQAGVDVLRIGDDIANQRSLLVSPALYRERIKPFHASVIRAARAENPAIQVLYHSDGNLTDLIPDLIHIGVTAINPVQPECMDLVQTKREFGQHVVLWGCCPVQSVYASGSREEVLGHVRLLKEELAPGGGLVVQFYNMILTPKVQENLRFFFDAFARA